MAYLDEAEILEAYQDSTDEADQWRIDYPQYERLADNGLLDDLDENLPEVNDGSLAASLFKLAKRVIRKKLSGRAKALDRDDEWLTELANIYWEKKILPNAKSKASPRRKWKDAVRKAAIFGGQPIITLFVERGNYRGADFIVPYAQDVKLEAGKDSDEDSDILFWDVYYSNLQVENMIEEAAEEMGVALTYDEHGKITGYVKSKTEVKKGKAKKPELEAVSANAGSDKPGSMSQSILHDATEANGSDDDEEEAYNDWDLDALINVHNGNNKESRPGNQQAKAEQGKGVKRTGHHFFIAFQRGVNAPFKMMYPGTKKCVRSWTNPDPTGDVPIHYLYCYQDFINPYGIGIVKLAGGTQNVLDYMRQADVLATQLGLRPPKQIQGDEDEVDEDSLVYAQDANWYVGNAKVERMEMANGVYSQLPGRISMYQTSLQKYIPMGDTSISAGASGDPQVSKVPAAIKLQAQNLSIDDEDFSENVDECYAAVAKSMINTQFANMQGSDLMKLDQEEIDCLVKAGLQFPEGSRELQIVWDNARAEFDFEINPESDKTEDDKAALDGMLKTYEMMNNDPNLQTDLADAKKKIDKGELLATIFGVLTENEKIVIDIDEEEAAQIKQAAAEKQQQEMEAAQKPQQQPKSLGESVAWKPGDLREGERAQALQQVGIQADQAAPETAAPNEQQQEHNQQMDVVNAASNAATTPAPGAPATAQPGQTPAPGADGKPAPLSELDTAKEEGHIKEVMKIYKVDAPTAAAMLEAERQGYQPEEILHYLTQSGVLDPKDAPQPQEVAHAA